MRLYSLSFLLGTLIIQLFRSLPGWYETIALGVCLLVIGTIFLLNKSKTINVFLGAMIALLLGVLLATYSSTKILENRLSPLLEGKNILVTGKIIDIPSNRVDGVRFRFKINQATLDKQSIPLKGIVRLGWYQDRQNVSAGEEWQFLIRLKRPSGFMNPGGFDYEKWLFTERIIATGYIRKSATLNNRISQAHWSSINHWRQKIHEKIQNNSEDKQTSAVLSALLVAVRNDLSDKQWQIFQNTGTSHLIAISGLHIAVVAGLAFLPIFLIWNAFPKLNERIPLRIAAGVVSIVFASVYAVLAGFTLPTQRALLMVVIGVVGLVLRKNYAPSSILAVALIAVLLLDPLAAMTISFWLSFLAVAFILYFLNRQIQNPFLLVIKLQIALSILMLPLTLMFFGNASLVSPLANLVAIPYVSLIIVPISLLGLLLLPAGFGISDGLFKLSSIFIDWFLMGLESLENLTWSNAFPAEIPLYLLLLALFGLLFVLLPKGFPGRWLGLILILPALLFKPPQLDEGEFRYTLLDVGQGMASVLQTKNHYLIYDTGTRISDSFDIGKLVLIPYLRSKALDSIDTLIVSHEDIDHRGGASSLLKQVSIDQIISSDTEVLPSYQVDACLRSQKWHWDGVEFEILSPPENYDENDNNRSCVLRVSNAKHSLLITGDIQHLSENYLMENNAEKINVNVMTIPHHGSKTSSSDAFIEATDSRLALVTAGYRSRFRHPHPNVISRYLEQGITVLNTVEHGAITVDFPTDDSEISYEAYRNKKARFWNR